MKTVLTISGKAQHGKDTFASMMKQRLECQGHTVFIVHYADYLKYLCKMYFGWDGEKDEKGRTILQKVGTDIVRARDNDFWVKNIAELLKLLQHDYDYAIIPDTRFPNEIEVLKNNYHFFVDTFWINRLNRDGSLFDNGLTDKQKTHPSETSLDEYNFDYIINATHLCDLDDVARILAERFYAFKHYDQKTEDKLVIPEYS
jgi:hypothetical protein